MLEALVASILNRVLGNYVSNLNYDQLKIAIWNGEVNLHNLKLRKDALDKLKLPIDVVEGYLGELTLSIPWSNLKTKPVKVHIRNVYLLAAPKTEASVDLKEEEERAQQLKQQKLETAELLETSRKDANTKKANNTDGNSGGFVSQLTTKVIDNLQFSLENIHLRYEDNVSCPDHPFAAGITLKELSAVSTDGEWNPAFIGDLANTIHKLAKLESLSVYWNTDSSSLAGLSHEEASQIYTDLIPTSDGSSKKHQYIVKPVSGTGKIKLNKSYGKDNAKIDTTLLFDELAFGLDDEQYRDALLLVDLFHSNLKKQAYLKLRPPHGTTPSSDPKAYFKFAGDAILSKIHERNYKWTWDHFKTRRDQRLSYIECYSAVKRNKATNQQKENLTQLERALSFEDIRFYRSIAKSRLRKEKIRIDEAKKKNANKGWFSSWWSGGDATSDDDIDTNDDPDSMVLSEQQKKELYDAIDYDEDKDSIENAVDIPKDTMKFVLNTKLNRGSFRISQHPHTTKHQLTSIVFERVGIEVIQYTDSMKISTSLGDLQLYDGSTKDTLYPQLIGVKKEDGKGTLSLLHSDHDCTNRQHVANDGDQQMDGQQPFLAIVYQKKPLDKKADQAIKLVMRHLEIIYNPTTIQGVISFFKAPSANSESFDALIEVAGDTLEGFKRQTRAGLEYALENHTTLDLDVDMDAPIIIIPENCLEEDSPVMIIDAGHIRVDSDLANQELAEQFKSNHEKEFGPDDYKRLESLMYDKFNVELTQIKLLIGRHVQKCIAQLEMDGPDAPDTGGDAHVLHRIDMNLLVERCILPGAPQFTKIKINGQLPLVSVNFSTQKYKTLMKIIDLVLPSSDPTTDDMTGDNQRLGGDKLQLQQQQDQQSQRSLFAQQFWGNDDQNDILLSDDGSSIYSQDHVNYSGNNNAAKSGPTRASTNSSNTSDASKKTEVARAQQNQFKFDFSVGHVSVLIYETAIDSTSKDILLCELILEQFGLEFINRPYDMYVHVWLQALNVLDKMEHGKEYHYLVTSNGAKNEQDGSQKDLVDVKYKRANSKHPLFEDSFDGYEQTVDVLLSTLTFVVTRDSVLTLYNWIMTTFTDSGNNNGGAQTDGNNPPNSRLGVEGTIDDRSSTQSRRLSLLSKGKQQQQQQATGQNQQSKSAAPSTPQDTGSIKVNIQMVGLQLILNKDGVRLGTGILSSGNVKVLLLPTRMMVMGKFGNFVLTDDSSSSIESDNDSDGDSGDARYLSKISDGISNVKVISIDDDELLDFTYGTLDPNADDFPGYHQHLYMRLGAFRLLYVDALKPILDFLSEFLQMKTVYDSARMAANTIATTTNKSAAPDKLQQQQQIQKQQGSSSALDAVEETQHQNEDQEESLFCFDIMMQSPIVIFPVGARKNNNVVVAHLGEIRASNEFTTMSRPNLSTGEDTQVKVNRTKCGLYSISLHSNTYDGDTNCATKEHGLPMLDDVDISVEIENIISSKKDGQDSGLVGPLTSIRGRISHVLMYLSEDQYSWLLEIENRMMTTFMGPSDEGMDENGDNEQITATSEQHQEQASTTTTDVMHNNSDTHHSTESSPDIQLDLCFDMELMCLEIFNGSEKDTARRDQHALCRLSFDDTAMKLQMTTDVPMLIEVQMRSINFYDIRNDSTSRFKDILPAGKQLGGPQLQLQYKTGVKLPNGQVVSSVVATLDRPQVVLSLDYLMLLKDFFAAPFMEPPPPTEAQAFVVSQRGKDVSGQQQQQRQEVGDTSSYLSATRPYSNQSGNARNQQTTSGSTSGQAPSSPASTGFHYKVNVVDLEIICLARPDHSNSEAMIVSFEELSVIQQEAFELRLNGIGVMLCRMDKRTESLMALVEPFNVGMDMQTLTSTPGHNNTTIDATIESITLRLSYHDFVLVMDIVNKVTALLNTDSYNKNDNDSTTSSDDDMYEDQSDHDIGETLNPASILSSPGYSMERNDYAGTYPNQQQQQKQVNGQKQQTNRLIEPYIVMSRESMNASFKGFQLIVVEDLHDLPFMDLIVKPFTVSVSDWSRALVANVKISTRFNYFNFKNSYWEPLIEPYNFEINASQEPTNKSLDIGVTSSETLNVNLTHTFLETVLSISSTLSDIQPLPENAQKQMKPFLIQNRTGYDLRFWNMSSDVKDGDTNVCLMKDGQDLDWTFRDWKKRKDSIKVDNNLLGIEILHLGWESIQNIRLDVEGKQSYRLKNGKDGIEHRVVVEVKLKNHVKSVVFHGGLTLDNQSEESMQITMVDSKRKIVSPVWTIESKRLFYVPIGLSYRPWIVIRPSDHYHWSDTLLHWSDMVHPKAPNVISCRLHETDSPEFIYQLQGVYDTKNSLCRQYPIMKIQFGAPIKITNNLPFDFKWTMTDQVTNQCISTVIKSGGSEQLHTFNSDGNLVFVMDIQNDDYEPTELSTILVTDSASQEGIPLMVKDKSGNSIYLRMVLGRSKKDANNGLRIKLYAPYLILNKSAHDISVRCRDSNYVYKAVTSMHNIPAYESQVTPYMFSYPKVDPKNRSEISIDGSKWSQALSFEAIGSSVDVRLSSRNGAEIHAGIHVEEGTGMYHLTKLVTISPRFVLRNKTHLNLKFAEYDSNEASTIGVDETLPLYMTRKSRSFKWLCLQLDDLENQWSTPFDLQEIGTTFIKVPKGGDIRPILIQASVLMKEATIFVTLKHTTDWPYLIINCSSTDITFYQEPSENDEHTKSKKSQTPPRKYHLTPERKYMKYSWDKPATKERRLILDVGGKTRVIDFQAIGTQIPFRYKKHYRGPGGGILSIDIAARDSALILLLTDFQEENSLFRPTSSGESTITPSSSRESSMRDHFETVDIELVVNYTFKLQLRGIGISVVNGRSQEIVYATVKDLDVKYTDSNMYQSVRAGIQWLQIDNQLFGTTYPILFYPSTLPKKAPPGSNVHPAFHLALDKVKDNTHGVTYFKLLSVLLQEMTVEVDEDLLYALIEFAKFDTQQQEDDHANGPPNLFDVKVEAPPEEYNQALLYFEEFCIQPMRLNLSFVRTARISTVDVNESTSSSPIGYIFDVFTMTIGNVNDAPVKLNALIVENLRASSQDLSSRITYHYQDQIIYQVHKVLGSADLIGNPVGLFNNLSSGFGELFYEPYQGFITSDRPQDLGIGIARGVGGFMKKSVFGFTDSFSRVTGSLGKGLAVATMDKKFQDRRRMKMTRNKPQHAIFGVTQGVTYFGTSVASGFAGLIKRPIEGAEESGVGGFFGGVGKGLVGVVTKPVVGLFDLASNVSAGIRETTNLFEAGAIVRERLPRYIGKDGTLEAYSQREALGQMWMKEMNDGHYNQEKYIAHSLADNDEETAILTYQHLFMVHTRKLEVEWCEKLENIDSCKWIKNNDSDENDDDGVLLIYTKTQPTRIRDIHFMEPTSGPWFTQQIQNIMERSREEKNRQ
ncbi:hypothetical protein BC941DRAFT_227149 [Chlamydoabsidia padenii]|nr:hypothetical protein BC941DRAFT_227149 [Chlamydoabsidia padenii]